MKASSSKQARLTDNLCIDTNIFIENYSGIRFTGTTSNSAHSTEDTMSNNLQTFMACEEF
jgi:hypothetical protein